MLGVLVLVVVAIAVLATVHRRQADRAARERAAVFDDVVGHWPGARRTDDGTPHPALSVTVDGRPVAMRVVVDALTLRKLPVLWLEVVARRPLPVGAPLNVLRRPVGTEFFSPDRALAHELAPPEGCPRPVRVATTDPDHAPALTVLEPAAGLLADPRLKEIGLGPRGVRAVWLVAECEPSSYRLGRRAVFGPARVATADVDELLAVLTAVGERADQAGHDEPAASGRSRS